METKNKVIFSMTLIYVSLLLFFAICVGKAVYVQYFEKSKIYTDKTYRELRNVAVPNNGTVRRGNILSANGEPLSVYVPIYTVKMDFLAGGFSVKEDSVNVRIKRLSRQLAGFSKEKTAAQFEKDLKTYRKEAKAAKLNGSSSYVKRILKKEIDIEERDKLKNLPYFKGRKNVITGLVLDEKGRREYPYGDMARHTIGFTWGDAVNDSEMSGIERSFNKYLRNDNEHADIVTTIDTRIQDIAHEALIKKINTDDIEAGTVVVMEVKTGEIKAVVNLEKSQGKISEKSNFAFRNAADPGSTFKIATLMAALESGKVDITDMIDCDEGIQLKNGRRVWKLIKDNNSANNGNLTVQRIVERSLNIGTAKFVHKAFNGNEDRFITTLNKIHAAEYFGLLDEEARPQVKHSSWNSSSMLQNAIGYELKISPLNTVAFFNAIANDGKMMSPMLVRKVAYADGAEEIFYPKVIDKAICSKSNVAKIKQVMSGVVNNGTARIISNTPYGIAGKTGTAQILFRRNNRLVYSYVENGQVYKKHQASFCGYFPDKNPEYTCIVVLYSRVFAKNAYGGEWAAPVFKEIADKLYILSPNQQILTVPVPNVAPGLPVFKSTSGKSFEHIAKTLKVPYEGELGKWVAIEPKGKKQQVKQIKTLNGIMPQVTGMGLKDAMYMLENMGMKVTFSGTGVVQEQIPAIGENIKFGDKVTLKLKAGKIKSDTDEA